MATALVRGMLNAGLVPPTSIIASDPLPPARANLASAAGITLTEDNLQVVDFAQVLVLAVKPQNVPALLGEIRPRIRPDHFLISIAAGIPLSTIRAGLGPDCRLARVMPNTPALLGAGAAGYCLDPGATPEDEALLHSCLSAVGRAYRLPETLMNAVTGLSGSGPAYVFQIIEALADGGVRVGLPRDVALGLAAQTVLGSARMVLETGQHPAALKDQVASPGGTTIAGLHALERGGLRAALIDAVEAATARSAELSRTTP
jgi:pyrroline-5-carboxylate reductase